MLDHAIPFSVENSERIFSELPEKPAVFAVRGDVADAEPYLNKTANLRKRLERLLSPPPESKRLNLRESARHIEYTLAGSEFENRLLLYREMRREFPRSYRKRMKLTPSALLKIGWENDYPRAYFTRRLGRISPTLKADQSSHSVYYGPFSTKAVANKFLGDALDLFKSRRCTFNIHPDPTFPGCMYSEMKMCLAPCFGGCTREEYLVEINGVQDYLDTRAGSLVAQLEAERDAASANLEFEQASSVHARIEKVKSPWTGIPEIVGRIDRLRAIIVQRSAVEDHVALFEFRNGLLYGPIQFSVQGMMHPNPESGSSSLFLHPHIAAPIAIENGETKPAANNKPETLEGRLSEALSHIDTRKPQRGELVDHLALLRRWYYRKNRKGEVFITHEEELPLRRIARGISRVFQDLSFRTK